MFNLIMAGELQMILVLWGVGRLICREFWNKKNKKVSWETMLISRHALYWPEDVRQPTERDVASIPHS